MDLLDLRGESLSSATCDRPALNASTTSWRRSTAITRQACDASHRACRIPQAQNPLWRNSVRLLVATVLLVLAVGAILVGLAVMGIGILVMTGSNMPPFAPGAVVIAMAPFGAVVAVAGFLIAGIGVYGVFQASKIAVPRGRESDERER
jgi:hypothetical protein